MNKSCFPLIPFLISSTPTNYPLALDRRHVQTSLVSMLDTGASSLIADPTELLCYSHLRLVPYKGRDGRSVTITRKRWGSLPAAARHLPATERDTYPYDSVPQQPSRLPSDNSAVHSRKRPEDGRTKLGDLASWESVLGGTVHSSSQPARNGQEVNMLPVGRTSIPEQQGQLTIVRMGTESRESNLQGSEADGGRVYPEDRSSGARAPVTTSAPSSRIRKPTGSIRFVIPTPTPSSTSSRIDGAESDADAIDVEEQLGLTQEDKVWL
jgi:hypothetical protein